MKNQKRIYLDHAATTYVTKPVMDEMLPYFTENFGNGMSLHNQGESVLCAINNAREKVATAIGANAKEIYFTSGATEANNWIINGIAKSFPDGKILVSSVEHPSIHELAKKMQKNGYNIEFVAVGNDGIIDLHDLQDKLKNGANLCSIITANNEVGVIQPIAEIAKLCNKYGVPFHTDATQAIGSVYINVTDLGISALSLSSHKLYGPKGVGALYIRDGFKFDNYFMGGHQERNRRGGTHNSPAIVGFGKAIEITMRDKDENNARITKLRDYLIDQVQTKISHTYLNGHREKRLPNSAHLSFEAIEGEAMLMLLDIAGISVSTGSACSSTTLDRSHVLNAMRVPIELNQASLRFTLGRGTTKDEIDTAVAELEKVVKRLRSISPLDVGRDLTAEELKLMEYEDDHDHDHDHHEEDFFS